MKVEKIEHVTPDYKVELSTAEANALRDLLGSSSETTYKARGLTILQADILYNMYKVLSREVI